MAFHHKGLVVTLLVMTVLLPTVILPKVLNPSEPNQMTSQNTNNDALPLVAQIMAAGLAISEKTASCVQTIFKNGELEIADKGGLKNYQTIADRRIEQILVGNLRQDIPGLNIVGEEGEHGEIDLGEDRIDYQSSLENFQLKFTQLLAKNQNSQAAADLSKLQEILEIADPSKLTVWLDPIDGTKELIDGLVTQVTTLIGITYKGRPIAGIINQPFYKNTDGSYGRNIWGIVGAGAVGFEQNPVPAGRIITTSRSHMDAMVKACVDSFEPTQLLRYGGCGGKVLQLLENKAHAYVFASPWSKRWDTCAPEAVLMALGGRLTDVHGQELIYEKGGEERNKGGVIAAVENLDYYLERIPEEIKEELSY